MGLPVDIASLMPTLFGGKALGRRLKESGIWRIWQGAVGAQIASKAQPAAFRDGVLTVVVSSAPWMQQLGFLKRQMIESINGALGEELVKEIYLKAGTVSAQTSPPKKAKRPRRELTEQERIRIEAEAAVIPDEELRAAFLKYHAEFLRNKLAPS